MQKIFKKNSISSNMGRLDKNQEWYDAIGFNNSPKIVKKFYVYYSNKPQSQLKNKIK